MVDGAHPARGLGLTVEWAGARRDSLMTLWYEARAFRPKPHHPQRSRFSQRIATIVNCRVKRRPLPYTGSVRAVPSVSFDHSGNQRSVILMDPNIDSGATGRTHRGARWRLMMDAVATAAMVATCILLLRPAAFVNEFWPPGDGECWPPSVTSLGVPVGLRFNDNDICRVTASR